MSVRTEPWGKRIGKIGKSHKRKGRRDQRQKEGNVSTERHPGITVQKARK